MTDAQQTRSIETEFEIAAPVDAVWKALTDADELTNWFPLSARVKPGVGGSIVMTWGEELADCDLESAIRVWEENKHLQFVWIDATPPDQAAEAKANGTFAPVPVAVDFHLEARGSTTVLRLVHTGFSPDPSWDHQYDGTVRGWQFELRGLKHYLENHRDTKRVVIHARQTFDQMSLSQAWDRLISDSGLCAEGTVNALKSARSRYRNASCAAADRSSGSICMTRSNCCRAARRWPTSRNRKARSRLTRVLVSSSRSAARNSEAHGKRLGSRSLAVSEIRVSLE